mmetsp:Transcript_35519/g.52146  ORF Transcript_35519/g.52146 Transcript_35519/m.52146 type:complete len:174 (-) Transcript_35519:207-728(-)
MKIASRSCHTSATNTMSDFTLSLILLLFVSYYCTCKAFHLSPSTMPMEIIEKQLTALQDNDMTEVYKFASPANKAQTGNAANFGKMVRSGPYRYLVGHSRSEILLESKMSMSQKFLVRVISSPLTSEDGEEESYSRGRSSRGGRVIEYWWCLSRCYKGEFAGSFMVDAVIPNL